MWLTMTLKPMSSLNHAMTPEITPATADGAARGLITLVLPLISEIQPQLEPVSHVTTASVPTQTATNTMPTPAIAGILRSIS